MTESGTDRPRAYARRKARRALVQATYQWQMNDVGTAALRAEFHAGRALIRADGAFFDDILGMVTRQAEDLDAAFSDFLDRDLKALNQVELAILRLGACELLNRPEVPLQGRDRRICGARQGVRRRAELQVCQRHSRQGCRSGAAGGTPGRGRKGRARPVQTGQALNGSAREVDEFELIDEIVAGLGQSDAPWLRVGPGDDAAVVRVPDGFELASSIDSFLAGIHFPAGAAPELIAYRSLMASLSDLAAMGAEPAWALVALNLPDPDKKSVAAITKGLVEAGRDTGVSVAGGNLAAGPLALTVSVHGWAPSGSLLLRGGARPGDAVCVSGPLGGAARALQALNLAASIPGRLSALETCYWRPRPPFELAARLRGRATSCIDVSDGLLQDIGHLCRASGVGASLRKGAVPLMRGASLEQALGGGDDYVLCFTTADAELRDEFGVIGEMTEEQGVVLDGETVEIPGYRHF